MDAVTYPHPDVKSELTYWVARRSDITQERDLATAFEIAVIPTAVLLGHDGRILDRVLGFLPPDDFRQRLSRARGDR